MANRRLLVKRRKAVRNIRKITRTMQLIATSRFQAALNRATATKPYSEKLVELVADLTRNSGDSDHPLMHANEEARRSALIVITSNRGLCGGYNANVLRTAIAHLNDSSAGGVDCEVSMVGKKGANYFKFLRRAVAEKLSDISDPPIFDEIETVANKLMDRFVAGEISSAHVCYMRFVSVARQKATIAQLLPLTDENADQSEESSSKASTTTAAAGTAKQYEFSPGPEEILNELLPATVRIRLFQCFTDATVSEQLARMVAMKAATDAADDMITSLTRKYNRARQTQITLELLDIVGGANALD